MINNEEKKEDIPKLSIKPRKSDDSTVKVKKPRLKIEISQIHTIEDDDFIIKPSMQEDKNNQIESLPKMNSPSAQTSQSQNFPINNSNESKIEYEIMNNNEKNTIVYRSVKELNYISHSGFSDINATTFAPQSKKPFWPDNLWKGGTLIYSYKNPEKCLGPPVLKNDKTIRFNSRFESGNLMYAYRLNPDTYHCVLEYDHTLTGQCQWFYFQMSNIKTSPNPNRKTTFYISGFNKSNGVFSNGSRIFMYSEKLAKNKKISWYRAGTNYSYAPTLKKPGSGSKKDKDKKNGKKSKNKRSTLQFQVTFPYDDDVVYFCYALPYTYTDLNNSISRWLASTPSLITRRTLCKTYGGKNCPLLTITSTNSSPVIKKRCIFITARIHPGESNGSIVLHGLIDFLLSPQPITSYLLDHFVFQIVPMINIDGVIEGYYRVGLEGDDLNRVWNNPDEIRHPVVFHTKNLMFQMNKELGIAAYIDFHGHSRQHGTFAYGCPWEPSENLPSSFIDKEKVFPKMLAFLCDAFSFEKCVFSIPPERKDASRCVIRREMGVINSFTIESSFGGFCSGPRRNTLYMESTWKEIGARVAEALFHLLSSEPSPLAKLINSGNFSSSAVQPQTLKQHNESDFEEEKVKKSPNNSFAHNELNSTNDNSCNSSIQSSSPVPVEKLNNSKTKLNKSKVNYGALGDPASKIFDSFLELANREIKKQDLLIQQKLEQMANKNNKSTNSKNKQTNSNYNYAKNNGFKPSSIDLCNNNKAKQRSKSTVRSLALPQSSFNAVGYRKDLITAKETVKVNSIKNRKQKPKNVKQHKLNEKQFQSKAALNRNRVKNTQNFLTTVITADVVTSPMTTKVIKSPRLSKSMKVMKSSRVNKTDSNK